ncbi:hypothetical protein [Vulgatibacter sp.]|uniref:hypothetical protein n=1 Tax=Vulgatibacter sp. TaxID=1971226 RepID=UPI00356A5B09
MEDQTACPVDSRFAADTLAGMKAWTCGTCGIGPIYTSGPDELPFGWKWLHGRETDEPLPFCAPCFLVARIVIGERY